MSKTVGTILNSNFIACYNKKPTKAHAANFKIIIGIDPGLQNLGLGIIKIDLNKIGSPIIVGKRKKISVFEPNAISPCIQEYSHLLLKIKQGRKIQEKLWFIFQTLDQLFSEHKPDLIIVEDAFVGVNKNSALKLGLARGAILSAIGKYNLDFQTLAPKFIKSELTGNGAAQKEDIQATFKQLLKNWPENMKLDSSDALAAAFCGIKILNEQNIEKNQQ